MENEQLEKHKLGHKTKKGLVYLLGAGGTGLTEASVIDALIDLPKHYSGGIGDFTALGILAGASSIGIAYGLLRSAYKQTEKDDEEQSKISFRKHSRYFAFLGLFDISLGLGNAEYLRNCLFDYLNKGINHIGASNGAFAAVSVFFTTTGISFLYSSFRQRRINKYIDSYH